MRGLEASGGLVVNAFDCGQPHSPRFESRLLLHRVECFLYSASPWWINGQQRSKYNSKTKYSIS